MKEGKIQHIASCTRSSQENENIYVFKRQEVNALPSLFTEGKEMAKKQGKYIFKKQNNKFSRGQRTV